MVGTTLIQVQALWLACSQKRAAENLGGIARLPPWDSGASMVTAKALMWYSGSTASTRSWARSACSALMAAALAARLAWVSITPLGCPVVPEVYISSAIASGSGTGRSASASSHSWWSGSLTSTPMLRGMSCSSARTEASQSGLTITRLQSL